MIQVMKKIFIGSDHGGFELKGTLKDFLAENFGDIEVIDCGPDTDASVDYPLYGEKVAQAVVGNPDALGIVICGSGIGISMAANKVKGARVALCNSVELAGLSRQHNGANILAMGERTQFLDDPEVITKTFLTTDIDPSDRHARRRGMLDAMIG